MVSDWTDIYRHLSNNGVEETPPSTPYDTNFSGTEQCPDPHKLFVDLEGCNVGFTCWHPVPATRRQGKLCGQGEMGGVWEWTSSVLEKLEGFEPMDLYPAYTGTMLLISLTFRVLTTFKKPTSLMGSITSSREAPGPRIQGLPAERHCEWIVARDTFTW